MPQDLPISLSKLIFGLSVNYNEISPDSQSQRGYHILHSVPTFKTSQAQSNTLHFPALQKSLSS